MNKFYIILLFSLSLCNNKLEELDSIIFSHFQKFIKKYEKKYTSLNEYLSRFDIFKKNIIETLINEESSYKTGITIFSDLTIEEFRKKHLNLKFDSLNSNYFESIIINNENDAPSEFDWRDRNVVTEVGDEYECNSNYAFSAIGNLEGLYAIEKNILKNFSIQMILDCDTYDSSCNGGIMESTFEWIKKNGGINFEEDYPYRGYKHSCNKNPSKYADMKVTGYQKLGKQYSTFDPVDENDMKEFLYKTGPLSIAFNGDGIFNYVSGVIDKDESKCPRSGISHAALLVGYGNDPSSGLDFWIVKNNWSTRWGEKGYFRIRRGNGTCGINCYVITATVDFN